MGGAVIYIDDLELVREGFECFTEAFMKHPDHRLFIKNGMTRSTLAFLRVGVFRADEADEASFVIIHSLNAIVFSQSCKSRLVSLFFYLKT